MATIGQALTTPETGWKRFDTNPYTAISGGTAVTNYTASTGYRTEWSGSSVIATMKFFGTKFRLIAQGTVSTFSSNINITIDGSTQSFSESMITATATLVFESAVLTQGIHTIIIQNTNANSVTLDSIDLDDTGYLVHPILNEKTSLKDMQVGDVISCRYTATTSGAVGAFSDLGTTTESLIPSASSATPDGAFYFIHAGYDYKGRMKLIADRNIQHSISWDTLNTNGFVSEIQINKDVYVDSSTGDDNNDGSVTSPVKTLQSALNRSTYNSMVILSKGIYTINTTNKALLDLVTDKMLTFRGQGKDTIIEVPSGLYYSAQKNIGASFENLTIRPSNTYSGETRVIWYNADGVKVLFLNFTNVLFTRSQNESYPTNCYFYWGNSGGTTNYPASFINCSAMSVPTSFEANGYPKTRIDCAFGNTQALSGTNINTIIGATFDASYKVTSTNTNSGVYFGKYRWDIPYNYTKSRYNITTRLLTGGVSTTDTDNEWDKIIVNSTLGGKITAGDNNVWNWSGVTSWTSTSGPTNTNRVRRGNGTVSTYANTDLSSTTATTIGYRPMLLVEIIRNVRQFVRDTKGIYCIKSTFYQVGSTLDETQIESLGAKDLSLLTTKMDVNTISVTNKGALGSGILYESFGIDLSKSNTISYIDGDTPTINCNMISDYKPIDSLENQFDVMIYIR